HHQLTTCSQFYEDRGRVLDGAVHDDSRQNLTCSSQRFAIADNTFGEWHAAGSTARSQLDFSIQGQQRRNTIRSRRGITKIPSNCPAILDLDGTDLSRCAL